MDEYTKKTKYWLDVRFKQVDRDGIYYAHQPIYGFRRGHCERDLISRFTRTYQIMKALSHLRFNSLLDVGGAEGFTVYRIKEIFNVKVRNSDLSEEACKRAKEIFNIESDPVDIHELPYKDNEFDIVLSSETLEHVTNLDKAISELIRVAKKAIIITVPHEDDAIIERNIKEKIPHAHIHSFHPGSFHVLESRGYRVFKKRMINSILRIPMILVNVQVSECTSNRGISQKNEISKIFIQIYNTLVSVLLKIFGKKAISFMVQLDGFICNFVPFYNAAFLFIILKDDKCYMKKEHKKISVSKILEFSVPYYYLNKEGI